MAEPGDPDWDESVYFFRKRFAKSLSELAAEQQSVDLTRPSLEYVGRSAAGPDIAMTSWRATINMYVDQIDGHDEQLLGVGFLDLFTLPLDMGAAEALDAVSADTAAYLELLSGGTVSDEVRKQFNYPLMSGLLILDRAYVHPAFRGHNIGVWAVAQAVHDLTFGSSDVLVVTYPTPIQLRPRQTEEAGAKLLAAHWARAGFERISACPHLVGQSTAHVTFTVASNALAQVAEAQISVTVGDLEKL
jgi:GNAT superfamily N-acetyltransferase